MNNIINKFQELNIDSKLTVIPYLENKNKWNIVFNDIEYRSIFYSEYYMGYQSKYFSEIDPVFEDCSLIFAYNKIPIGIWPICIISSETDNRKRICSFDRNIIKPAISKSIKDKIKKFILNISFKIIKNLIEKDKIYKTPIFFDNYEFNSGVSLWHQTFTRNRYKLSNFYTLYLKLDDDINKVKKHFRKSFRSLINIKNDKFKIIIL